MKNESERFGKKEIYSLSVENIIPIKEVRSPEEGGIPKKWIDEFDWTKEFTMGGWGRVLENNKFEIAFPVGEKFLSYAIILHELGHLRQEEMNLNLKRADNEKPNKEWQIAKEEDAAKRGWERILRYAPDFLSKISKEFQDCSSSDDVKNFKELYDVMNETSVLINDIMISNENEDDRYEAFQNSGVAELFSKLNNSKKNELINEEEAVSLVLEIGKKIADEK